MSRRRSLRMLPLVAVLAMIVALFSVLSAPVSAATVSVCATGCDYTSIQAAVSGETYPVTVNVYPGTYNESVDLYKASGGNVTLKAVNSAGTPTPGAATVNGTSNPAFHTSSEHSGNITITGFLANSDGDHAITLDVNSDIVIRDVTASDNGEDGIHITGAGGNVTIQDCTANSNDSDGIWVDFTYGNLIISDCTTNGNEDRNIEGKHVGGNVSISGCTGNSSRDDEGIDVYCVAGNVTIEGSTANANEWGGISVSDTGSYCEYFDAALGADGSEEAELEDHEHVASVQQPVNPSANGGNVTIKNCTANENNEAEEYGDGISVSLASGDVTMSNCTTKRNGFDGIRLTQIDGAVQVTSCISRDNVNDGIELSYLEEADFILVNGSVICGNGADGLEWDTRGLPGEAGVEATSADATGNWWGCAGGPDAAGCDTVEDWYTDSVDYSPWIKSISAGASVDPVTAGQPTVVSFQFSGGPPAVYLGQGPGDLRGSGPFTVSTDNGSINGNGATVEEFINEASGTLSVTLVPSEQGTATLTVVGPCGLEEQLVLGVLAAEEEEEFVPEAGTVALLASGLAGLAGYTGLRLRRKKQ